MRGDGKVYRQSARKLLRTAYRNSSRKRSLALTLTSGMLMFLGILLAGFLQGKLQTDMLRYQREHGSSAYVYVENGSENTAELLKELPMILKMGFEKQYGRLLSQGAVYSECSAMEEKDWNEWKAVACTEIYGEYPREADEIMMSVKMLESLGIRQPQIGMKLSLEFYWHDIFTSEEAGEQEFTLSGYYTDYAGNASGRFVSYISTKKLEQARIPMFPCRILLQPDAGLRSGEQTQEFLDSRISLGKDEYFVTGDSAFYKSIHGMMGGFGTGAALFLLLILGTALLIGQMIRISFLKEVWLFRQMENLGVTVKQIRQAVCGQLLAELVTGTAAGGAAAYLLVWLAIPEMMTEMYMDGMGTVEEQFVLSLPLCAGIALFVCLTGFLSAWGSFRKLLRAEAGKEAESEKPGDAGADHEDTSAVGGFLGRRRRESGIARQENGGRKKKERLWGKRSGGLTAIAWRAVGNSRWGLFFSILTVALGGTVALCVCSMTSGADLMRKLEEQPEFRIAVTLSGFEYLQSNEPEIHGMAVFPESLQSSLEELAAEKEGRTEARKGYLIINPERKDLAGSDVDGTFGGKADGKENTLEEPTVEENAAKENAAEENTAEENAAKENTAGRGLISGLYRYATDVPQTVICVLTEAEERRFLELISSEQKTLENGEGILVHKGIPFRETGEEAWEDMPIRFWDMVANGAELSEYLEDAAELRLVDCVDLLKTDLQGLELLWKEENVCWILVSEETARELSKTLCERTLQMELWLPPDVETEKVVRQCVAKANEAFRDAYGVEADLVSLTSKSQVLADERRYLENSRFCMTAVCVMLFLLGFVTYVSTRYLELAMRERELRMLRVLEVTGRQLKHLLQLEGLFHCAVVALLLAAAGLGAVSLLDQAVKQQSENFYAHFPWAAYGLLCLLLAGASVILAQKISKHSLT